MTHDMTKGNPLQLILRFTIPVFFGNLFQQVYNLADALIAGRYIGVNALAAIGSTGSLIFFVLGWLTGLTSGFAILVAQSFGAQDMKRLRHYLAMSIYLIGAMVLVMTVGLTLVNVPILRLMNTPENILPDTATYMHVIYLGLIATAAYDGLAAILRAVGDSRSPLYFLVISAVINVVLDIVFVLQFHTGVVGCAYATVISQGISALLCLIYMIKKYEILHLHREDMKFSWYSAVQMLNLGVPMGLQFSITAIGTIIVQGAINVFGEAHIAGFSAANKVQNVCTTMFAAFGATIATYTGQNLGAGRMDRVREGVKVTLKTLLVFSVVIAIIISAFGVQIARLFVGGLDTEVLGAARNYFQAVIWFYPFLACIFLYRNTLQGLGYGLVPMLGGVSELFARGMVVVVLARFGKFFLVCLADPAAWIFALLPIVPYYYYISKKVLTNEYK